MTNKARAGRQIAFRTFGTGPRQALAIHCSLAHSGAWSGVAAALAEDMTITAFDMPGHGRSSDWDGNGDYLQAVAAIAATFLTEPVDLIGHSAGGIAALQLALLPEGLALRKHRVSTAPQRLESIPVGVKSFAADADQGLGAGITEYFCVPVIAAHNAALAQKHDAHPGTVQQDLLFAQSALQGGVGSRGGTLQF